MPVSDWSKLASFDAATFQIFVVADSAVATVNAFVAEAISFAHFVHVFVTRTVHFQISGPPFLPLFLRILAPSSRAVSPFSLKHSIASPPDLLLFFSFFSSSFSVSSWLFLVLLNLSMALFLISSPFFFSSFSNFFAFSFCSSQTPSPIPPTPPPPF